jgi:uncharacterized membrane protein
MKKLYFPSIVLLLLCLSSCSVIGGIFKAGIVFTLIAVVVVILLIKKSVSLWKWTFCTIYLSDFTDFPDFRTSLKLQ